MKGSKTGLSVRLNTNLIKWPDHQFSNSTLVSIKTSTFQVGNTTTTQHTKITNLDQTKHAIQVNNTSIDLKLGS